MSEQQLVDQLVATYSELNHKVRMHPEEALVTGDPSIREVIGTLRTGELRFSQDLKARVTGQPVSYSETHEIPRIGTETDDDSTASLIAQFGTAREATLAMLRTLSSAAWDETGSYDRSIRTDVLDLIDRDKSALTSILPRLGSNPA
jgi:hypothetical protein